jgi:hypothetical protein
MATRSRRSLAILPLVLALATCGPSGTTLPSAPTDSTEPSLPVASAPAETTPAESPAASGSPETGQTDTEWGRIWDTLPAGFPRFPGATPADDAGGEPASARFAVEGGDPLAIATWFQDALEQATFSTLGFNGPGEDGGYVIDSTGEGDCRLQTTVTPLGGTTFASVLYGADCPAP